MHYTKGVWLSSNCVGMGTITKSLWLTGSTAHSSCQAGEAHSIRGICGHGGVVPGCSSGRVPEKLRGR